MRLASYSDATVPHGLGATGLAASGVVEILGLFPVLLRVGCVGGVMLRGNMGLVTGPDEGWLNKEGLVDDDG